MNRFRKFLTAWNEGPFSLLFLLLFLFAGPILHFFTPDAGVLNVGYLNVVIFASLLFWLAAFTAWNFFRLQRPRLYKWFVSDSERELITDHYPKSLDRTYKTLKLCYAFYFGAFFLFSFLVLVVVLMLPK